MSANRLSRAEKIALLIVAIAALAVIVGALVRNNNAQSVPPPPTATAIDTSKTYRADSLTHTRKLTTDKTTAKSRTNKSQKAKPQRQERDMTLTPDEEQNL